MSEPFPADDRDVDADHLVETPESLRDDDPEAPALDRGIEPTDRPLGAEKFGTTQAEAEQGESLDKRQAEEVAVVRDHDPVDDVVADDPTTFGAAEETDDEVLGDVYGDPSTQQPDVVAEPAGRLVEPDEGVHEDTEKDAVATAVGRDGGDVSAEEAAMHLEDER